MDKIEEINIKISANKEVLETLPRNNEKNRKIYAEKAMELKTEFLVYKDEILNEMERRYEKVAKIKINPEINLIKKQLEEIDKNLYLLNRVKTPYEKMNLDRAIQDLRYYYKKKLEIVNETIDFCTKKFQEVGIELTVKDFCYSKFVTEYIEVFFAESKRGAGINSDKIKAKFEKIYWKCPDIITHIELNIRYIYLKYEKEITKYYEKRKQDLTTTKPAETITSDYEELKRQYIDKRKEDKYLIISDFLEGRENTKEYTPAALKNIYAKYADVSLLDNEEKREELDINIKKLLNSIYEYRHYLKYQFIIDDIKSAYKEKDKFKSQFEQAKKDVSSKENTVLKLNAKIEGKGLFKKPNEKHVSEQNALIIETKKAYRELDRSAVFYKIATELNDNSSIMDVLYLAMSSYSHVFHRIRDQIEEISEEKINEMIAELRAFIRWPYFALLNNIEILEEKDVLLIIKDRYKLLGINLEKETLTTDNIEQLEKEIARVERGYYLRKNKINVEEIGYICEFKKILEKK